MNKKVFADCLLCASHNGIEMLPEKVPCPPSAQTRRQKEEGTLMPRRAGLSGQKSGLCKDSRQTARAEWLGPRERRTESRAGQPQLTSERTAQRQPGGAGLCTKGYGKASGALGQGICSCSVLKTTLAAIQSLAEARKQDQGEAEAVTRESGPKWDSGVGEDGHSRQV